MKDRLLWLGCAAYAALFTALGAIRYGAHRNFVDFGIFQQTAASAFGCFCNPLEGSHWAFHFSPVLYLAGAALALVRSPLTLVALQAVACALAAPPVYAIVAARCGTATARLAALAVWLYPPLAGLTFGDFHENGFAPAAVAWALYAFDARKLAACTVAVAFALAVKEDQALFLAFAAGAGAYAYRSDPVRVRFAAVTGIVCLALFATFFLFIAPHANADPAWQPVRFYAWTADDVRGLLRHGLLERLGFLALILVPLALVPLRTPAFALAIPPLLEVLTSRMNATFTLGSHYAGAWMGYVLVAFAAGLIALDARGKARTALYWALGLCVLELAVANPMHPGSNLRARSDRDARLDAALAALPPGISLATQEEAYTHLALDDRMARLLPETPSVPEDACAILIDREFPESPRLQEYGPALPGLVARGQYALVRRDGGIELYRNTGQCR